MARDSSGRGNHLPLYTPPTASLQTIHKVVWGVLCGVVGGSLPVCCAAQKLRLHHPIASVPPGFNLPACYPPQAGGKEALEVGVVSLRNSYAMNQGFAGMPDR